MAVVASSCGKRVAEKAMDDHGSVRGGGSSRAEQLWPIGQGGSATWLKSHGTWKWATILEGERVQPGAPGGAMVRTSSTLNEAHRLLGSSVREATQSPWILHA